MNKDKKLFKKKKGKIKITQINKCIKKKEREQDWYENSDLVVLEVKCKR